MSRATRPLRRVRGPERERFMAAVLAFVRWPVGALDPAALTDPRALFVLGRIPIRVARALGTRPAVVRRCLLGRPVSAHAARRILA